MPSQRAGPMAPEDNGVPSTIPTNTYEDPTMAPRPDGFHQRPASSKLPLAAQSPYLVNQPLTLSPTADLRVLTHKTLSFLINTSLHSMTCLITESL